jgi:hypothetical protein
MKIGMLIWIKYLKNKVHHIKSKQPKIGKRKFGTRRAKNKKQEGENHLNKQNYVASYPACNHPFTNSAAKYRHQKECDEHFCFRGKFFGFGLQWFMDGSLQIIFNAFYLTLNSVFYKKLSYPRTE